jgi:hypothetical protein
MHVTGNGSATQSLHWFTDRSADALPQASAISLPLWVYKVLMLAWALWLANALIGWLREGFSAWTRDGYWRARVKPELHRLRRKQPTTARRADGMTAPAIQRGALLAAASAELGGDESAREVELLLGHALGKDRAWLYAHADDAWPSTARCASMRC